MRDNTPFKNCRIFLIINGTLRWWGSYKRRGDGYRYLRESGGGVRAMWIENEQKWVTMVDDVIADADVFTSRLLSAMPADIQRGVGK